MRKTALLDYESPALTTELWAQVPDSNIGGIDLREWQSDTAVLATPNTQKTQTASVCSASSVVSNIRLTCGFCDGWTVRLAFQAERVKQGAVASQHILFVDDEAPIRELLSLFFRKKGMEVTTAVNSAEAKELATKVPFTLAIVDVNLAGENGLDLLSFFKTNFPAAPVIIFTGLTGEDLVDKAMAGGANGFMRKTEPLSALFAEVSRHLPGQGVQQG